MKKLIPVVTIAAALLALTGCSAVQNLLYQEQTHEYEDVAAMQDDWSNTTVDWMPDDASDIDIRESTDGTVAILGFASDADLDAAACTETERLSAPSFGADDDWAPDDVFTDTVFACGMWAVIPTDDGWYGWTPSAPREQHAAPGGQDTELDVTP